MVLSTEWSQVEVIDLINDGNGLGFILVGGRSTGVVIKALTPGGVGERDGRLQCGDHLLQIGEVSLIGFSSEQVATVLRQTGAQVRLIVARPIEPTAIDYQTLASHAPIIPTKLLSDPEELSRHLFQNPSYATSSATGNGAAASAAAALATTTASAAAIVGDVSGGGEGAASEGMATTAVGSSIVLHHGDCDTTADDRMSAFNFVPSTPTSPLPSVTTPDAELADLPLPPIPGDMYSTHVAAAAAAAARRCPKDLDIVPFSIVSPPPSTSLLPAYERKQQQQQQQQQQVHAHAHGHAHIETVIAGSGVATGKPTTTTTTMTMATTGTAPTTPMAIDADCSSIDSPSYNMNSPETETYEVELHKNVYGLGITVAGYVCEEEDLSGIFVKSIIDGSAAEMSGEIQINDRIVAVDGLTLAGVTNHQAVELLRNTDIEVHLTLERFLRGRKYEHLQVALTELKGGDTQSQTSLPASPSIATLSWLPPRSDADSIATDGGAVIMEFSDLPSRDTVESNMSHMLDRSEHSNADSAKSRERTAPTTPEPIGVGLSNGAGAPYANGLHAASTDNVHAHVEPQRRVHVDHETDGSVGGGSGMKTPTNETATSTMVKTKSVAATIATTAANRKSISIAAAAAATTKTTANADGTAAAAIAATAITTTTTKTTVCTATTTTTTTTTSTSSPSAASLRVAWKSEFPESEIIVAEINKLLGLGISLEGTVDVECGIEKRPHHYIRSILEDGPVGRQGILRPGDELLQVNEHKLQGLKHIEVVKILKELPSRVKLVCVRGTTAPSIINTSQNPEAFETRSLLPGGHQSLQNLLSKAQSESSLYTSSTATLTDQQQRSKSLENVSGLALWCADVTQVEIVKTEQGFGFSILDYQDPLDAEGSVIVIRGLIRGGSAETTNDIFPGDRLVSVGEHSLHGLDLDEAVAILKGMPLGVTKLGICRPLSTSDSNSNIPSPVGDSPST